MNNSPSITDLPMQDTAADEALFRQGDMALILGADGSVRNVAFGIDTSNLNGDVDDLTEEELAVIDQGTKMFALTLAVNTPLLMNILIDVAANPDVIDIEALKRFVRPN